jgi:predicted nucleic acid-binding protein
VTRLVLDRNVLVSAAVAPSGTCAQLLEEARSGRIEVLLSPRLMDEVTAALADRLPAAEAGCFVWRLRGAGTLVNDAHPSWPAGQLDPGSAHVVALARERGADAVVTGHGGLLRGGAPGVRVVSPGAMLDQINASRRRAASLDRARAGKGVRPVVDIDRGLGLGR